MPGDTTTIIELTEIVRETDIPASGKENELRGQVSDLMREAPPDDIELDDLLAQLHDGVDDPAPSGRTVDPHEKLDMPGMDDMDAVMDRFDAPPTRAAAADDELDDLLRPETPAPAAGPDPDADAVIDELLGNEPAAAAAPVQDAELDDLLTDLDAPPSAKPIKEDELDGLLSELGEARLSSPPSGKKITGTQASVKVKAPVPNHPVVDDELEELFDDLDASIQAVGAQAARSLEQEEDEEVLREQLAWLNEQVKAMSSGLQTVLQQQQALKERLDGVGESAPASLDGIEKQMASLTADLDGLKSQLANLADPAALTGQIMDAMRPDIEKAAAAAAAEIIREEILAAFAGDDA